MQPILLKAPTEPVSNHGSEQASQTTLSLMELWRNLPSPPGEEHWKTIPSFNKQLCKWSVDCNLAAMFGVEHQQLDFDASLLVDHVRVVMETSAQLQVLDSNLEAENETELWHIFYGASESMLQMLENFVLRNPGSSHQGLIGRLRHEGRFHLAEVARIVADLIVAAADTTSTTAQWVLHLLACNPDEQEKIFADLSNENSDSHSPRIRWCLKEAMRLYPVAPFLTRVLPDPVDLSGHLIPAGQTVLVSTYAMGRSADYYDRPDEFWPDRWERQHMKSVSWGIDDLPPSQCDKDLKELGKSRAFSSLPFGFGRRACIGRRLAEDQLTTLTENVILNFELKNLNKAAPLEMTMRMTGVPVDEVQIGIKKRK